MSSRAEALAALCRPEHLDIVTGLLLSSDVRIAVPCAVLSKGANGTGSKVVVTVVRSQSKGPALALDCGRWWRGAPTGTVYMDYRQLLSHANSDALRALHRKLVGIAHSRLKGLARTQSVPGRLVLDELSGSSGYHGGDGASASSRLRRTSSGDLPLASTSRAPSPSKLHRTSSGSLPASGAGSGLRRTSSLGVPLSGSSSRPGGGIPRPVSSLHRLSGSTPRRTSPAASVHSDDLISPPAKGKAAAVSVTADCTTPEGALLLPVALAFEDSARGRQAGGGGSGRAKPAGSPGSPQRALVVLEPSAEFSSTTSASSSPFGGSSPYELGSPSSPTGGAADDEGGSTCVGTAEAGSKLSRQPTFSQPYFAQFEDEQPSSTPRAPIDAAAGGADSGSVREQQLAAAQEQMTSDELHEVNPSFNHVFVPPWAVPKVPQQPVVHAYREAGTQTSTGAAGLRTPTRQTHTAADVADHFEAFMQHFAAGLPHLAMALADMHLGRGGQDPLFIKSQFYFNSLLQLKDEMHHLQERLQPPLQQISRQAA